MFNAPIPGESLTSAPKNYPWERPPEFNDPEEVVMYHIDRLSEPDRLDNIIFILEYGMPVKTLVESLLTNAVSKGVHTIDTGLIVAPVIHKFLVSAAEDAQIDYKEEFDTTEDREEMDKGKAAILFRKAFKAMPKEPDDPGYQLTKELAEAPAKAEMPVEEAMPMEEEAMVKPKGLMSRGGK